MAIELESRKALPEEARARSLLRKPQRRLLRKPRIGEEREGAPGKKLGERKPVGGRIAPMRPPALNRMQTRRLETHLAHLSATSHSIDALLKAAEASPAARQPLRGMPLIKKGK